MEEHSGTAKEQILYLSMQLDLCWSILIISLDEQSLFDPMPDSLGKVGWIWNPPQYAPMLDDDRSVGKVSETMRALTKWHNIVMMITMHWRNHYYK